jgi:hypothetical protein
MYVHLASRHPPRAGSERGNNGIVRKFGEGPLQEGGGPFFCAQAPPCTVDPCLATKPCVFNPVAEGVPAI